MDMWDDGVGQILIGGVLSEEVAWKTIMKFILDDCGSN